MQRDNIVYWTATGIVAAIMFWSAYNFSFNGEMKGWFVHFGLPGWFRIELTIAKILGALVLVIPAVPKLAKDFAYAGFAITIFSAFVAHLSSGDGVLRSLEPFVVLGILIVSYVYFHITSERSARFPSVTRAKAV